MHRKRKIDSKRKNEESASKKPLASGSKNVTGSASSSNERETNYKKSQQLLTDALHNLTLPSKKRALSASFKSKFSIDLSRKISDKRGSLNLLSQKYESLDYDICENQLYMEAVKKLTYRAFQNKELFRWVIIFLIGILTALTACFIVICIDVLANFKFKLLRKWMDKCSVENCLEIPLVLWLAMNAGPALLSSAIVTLVAPAAAGSGIPAIKCYLNGVKIPKVVRIQTFFVKVVSVVLSVVGGLAVGKEGPMIHSGAAIAAGISQGKSSTLKKDFNICKQFRQDREKRDFVSAGAAAGVSAAFGAPLGGVLFSLEEGASFWNQALTWRSFFGTMICTFTLNLVMSAYHDHPGELSYSGLVNFGKFDFYMTEYSTFELPLYIIMSVIGGLLGALFNHINHKLTVFRLRHVHQKWAKILETGFVSIVTASLGFLLIISIPDCRQKENSPLSIQLTCPDGSYSVSASLWFKTPEATVKSLFHDNPNTWEALPLFLFVVVYFILAVITYGLSISSGLFIPTLLVGAAWGRLIANCLEHLWPTDDQFIHGRFALIGAAAMLAGVVRMTISLTVILIEATGNITFGLPLMITIMTSKLVGDYFNEGLYDTHIELSEVPFLGWEAPVLSNCIYVSEIMSTPVTRLRTVEKVGRIVFVLKHRTHNGFPVVDDVDDDPLYYDNSSNKRDSFGRFRGLVLRWQLVILLREKIFNENSAKTFDMLSLKTFQEEYPRYPTIDSIDLSPEEYNFTIDLRPVMNPSAYTVSYTSTLPRVFQLFRALGLRHLVVTNDSNEVIGVVTRKDLARYKMHYENGKYTLFEREFCED
ncbi:H(+)/Cl(-) exchange transporter 7-like protein [Dinothrombium tinctorium]|uniref:Chloride channel protein n=1 Tax=Dinothrombium tinctorium TaxID=1965070 RepID=A0A3S3RLV3_9ACAR|nr:H(+)/Cl(-) exchange transporter 7-like protein [Dinothrombium tinctorium]RWS02997.1 H(+)/Cl(-) exchange transporter 7-like protein [Dinothrombium tinctorium]